MQRDSAPLSEFLTAARPFVLGGIAGVIATTFVQPIDYVKTRLQLMGEGTRTAHAASPVSVAKQIIKTEGFGAMYTGIGAAYARQIVYGSARLGLFRSFSDEFKKLNGGAAIPAWQKVVAGLAAGGLASFIGNPTEVSLIRMQADATLPAAERRHYKGIFDAVIRIAKEEGIAGLWRGSSPTVARAMVLNMAMLATADQTKEMLAPYLGGEKARSNLIISSIISGVAASVASLPFDMVKTRLQKMRANPDGSMPYKGFIDCARQVAVKEGPAAFYKGLSTYIVRISPHVIITLITLDYLNMLVDYVVARNRKSAGNSSLS